ncbi:MAG TPA: arabinofuranosidase catalytic domain-containing protein [Kofleriaceae bacterium]|nr:arabinofuranosidase catalytic domain-containing protein [Kofleriaceae bacterium]
MRYRSRHQHTPRTHLFIAATAALIAGIVGGAGTARAAPCDIYAAGGTPCVAAHSTTRAMFSAYNGPLYQVRRSSDNTTRNIGLLSAGGTANAAQQDSFCAGTTCVITIIFDQSGRNNHLTQAPPGGFSGPAPGGFDNLANATAAPITLNGQRAYGVFVAPGTGYRNNATSGIATGSASQGVYMVAAGGHVNSGCCFDYGNAETNSRDTGNGHMGAVYFGTLCWFGFVVPGQCVGSGPWVMADLENGLFAGANGTNTNNTGRSAAFVTGMIKMNSTSYAIKDANAASGGLKTDYSGPLPTTSGYTPLHLEGAIILGIGGDNSNGSAGTFYEGVMTSGFPSDATENSVQANIVAARYGQAAGGTRTGPIVSGVNGAKCVDNNNAAATPGNKVQLFDCNGFAAAQSWTINSNGTITIDGGCLDITGNNSANGTLVEWWPCNGGPNQQWQAVNGQLVNPATGKCLDDPASITTNGIQLQIWSCSGASNQQWRLP